MTFTIKINPQAFVKRRLVSGPIWLELDDVSFPAQQWVDFPVIILGFWLTNIKPVMLGHARVCACPFMDGPFQFNVQADRGGFNVALVDRELDEDTTMATATVDSELLMRQIVSASEIVIQTCRRNQWIDDDLLNLEVQVVDAKRR